MIKGLLDRILESCLGLCIRRSYAFCTRRAVTVRGRIAVLLMELLSSVVLGNLLPSQVIEFRFRYFEQDVDLSLLVVERSMKLWVLVLIGRLWKSRHLIRSLSSRLFLDFLYHVWMILWSICSLPWSFVVVFGYFCIVYGSRFVPRDHLGIWTVVPSAET